MAWSCPGSMQESSTVPSRLIDNIVGKCHEIIAVVVLVIPDKLRNAGPSSPQSNNLIPFAVSTYCHRTYRRIEPGHISSSGQNSNNSLRLLLVDYADLFFSCCHIPFF